MKKDHFQTKYGDRIDFVEGYFELFPDLIAQYQDIIEIYDDHTEHLKKKGLDKLDPSLPPFWGASYLARHARTAKMIEMIEKYGERRTFNSALDIGTGHGVMPRLMKAFGLADKAYGLDLADRTYLVPSQQILDHENDIARSRTMDALKSQHNLPQTNWASRATQPEFGFSMNDQSFHPTVVTSQIDMDGLILGDVYKQQQKHDLVTSFASLCCFDSDKIMEKVSSLLDDGGVFFVYVNLWWFPINSTILAAHFPYAHARLDKDDWTRYAQEHHPEHFAKMQRLYEVIDSKHPTVSTYIETAAKNGLTLLGYERCIHTQAHDPRSRFSPNFMETFFENSYLTEVLNNIRRFRNDVSIEDLQTSHVFMAFKKRGGRPSKLSIDQSFKQKSYEPLREYASYTTMKPNLADVSVSGNLMTVVLANGTEIGPLNLPPNTGIPSGDSMSAYVVPHNTTLPEHLARSAVRLTSATVNEDLTLVVWSSDGRCVGTIVLSNQPTVVAEPLVVLKSAAAPERVRSLVESGQAARDELKHMAIAFAAKYLPPAMKAAIKKHIWRQ